MKARIEGCYPEDLMTTILLDPGKITSLKIESWPDPVIDSLGHDPRSLYVETYWLPVLGPSTTWLLRRVAAELDLTPEGFEIDLDETARSLGLGTTERQSRHSPFMRTLRRSIDFDMAQLRSESTLAVRRKLPPLSRRHLSRLPVSLQSSHERHQREAINVPAVEHLRRHGRQLAASLADTGEDQSATELQLMRWGFHPALARECSEWVFEQRAAAKRVQLRAAGVGT
jgi:hypothetical protein